MPPADRDVVIVSDLHLSAGYDERLDAFDRNEDFFYDAAFARFLEHLGRLRGGARSLATIAVALAAQVWRERADLRPATRAAGYMSRAAHRIDRILAGAGLDVPFYVF